MSDINLHWRSLPDAVTVSLIGGQRPVGDLRLGILVALLVWTAILAPLFWWLA